MQSFNPGLTADARDKGSEDGIEHPDRVVNVAWQTRAAPPTPAENALADALQAAFAAGVSELQGLVERLDGALPPPAGASRWTAALLAAELRRLGA